MGHGSGDWRSPIEEHYRILFLSLICLTFLIPLYAVVVAPIISSDGVYYVDTARVIDQGDWGKISEIWVLNLYPFLIVLFHRFIQDWEAAGRAVSLILGSAAVVPLFFQSRRSVGTAAALVAIFFYAVHPRLVEYSTDVLREATFWFFSLFALWTSREGMVRGRWPLIMLAALLTVCATFTRLEGVIIAFVIIAWTVWFVWVADRQKKKALFCLLVFLVSSVVFASPVPLTMKAKAGRWETGQVANKLPALILHEDVTKVDPSLMRKAPPLFRSFVETALRHRYAIYVAEVAENALKALGVVLLPFLAAGFLVRRVGARSHEDVALLFWFGLFFLGSVVYGARSSYFGTRHGLTVAMPALMLSGSGFWELETRIKEGLSRRNVRLPSFLSIRSLLLIMVLLLLVPQTLLSYRSDKMELKKAGLCLRAEGYQGKIFAGDGRLYRVGFYGGVKEFLPLPDGLDFNQTLRLAKERGAQFFLLDERTTQFSIEDRRRAEEGPMIEKIGCPALGSFKEYSLVIYRLL